MDKCPKCGSDEGYRAWGFALVEVSAEWNKTLNNGTEGIPAHVEDFSEAQCLACRFEFKIAPDKVPARRHFPRQAEKGGQDGE